MRIAVVELEAVGFHEPEPLRRRRRSSDTVRGVSEGRSPGTSLPTRRRAFSSARRAQTRSYSNPKYVISQNAAASTR